MAGYAGCMSGNSGSGKTDNVINTSGQLAGAPTDLQYNPWGLNYDATANLTVYEQFAHFDLPKFLDSQEISFIPRGAKEWSVPDKPSPGGKITVTGADDRKWHNGDPITANDLYTTYRINYFFDAPLFNYIDPTSLKKVGDKTVEMTLTTTVNPNLLKMRLLGRAYGFRFSGKHSIFKDYLKELETAEKENKNALKKAKQKLTEFSLDKPIGTGWAKFVKKSKEKIVYEPHKSHPIGKEMEIDQWTNRYAGSAQKSWEYALGQEIDVLGESGPMNVIKQTQKKGFKMLLHHYLSAAALIFNYGEKPFDDVRLRQAIAHATNLEKSLRPIKIEGEWGQQRTLVRKPTGIMVNEKKWLDDVIDGFTEYSPDKSDTEKSDALMKDMGYQKQNGKWAKGGKVLKIPVKSYSWSHIVSQQKSIVDDLKNAGFDAQLIAIGETSLVQDTTSANYKICTGFWGQSWHPATSLDILTDSTGWQELNHPETVEVPMPVGNPNGKKQTINVYKTYEEMATAPDNETAKPAIQKLAWVYNQTLPQIPMYMQYGMISVDEKNFEFDFDRWNGKLLDAQFEMMNRGLMKVKNK
jgi:peptide/nickel transport system substrate-binding protein